MLPVSIHTRTLCDACKMMAMKVRCVHQKDSTVSRLMLAWSCVTVALHFPLTTSLNVKYARICLRTFTVTETPIVLHVVCLYALKSESPCILAALQQVVVAHRLLRRRGSHTFGKIAKKRAITETALGFGRKLQAPRKTPGTDICQRMSDPTGHKAPGRIMSTEKSSAFIED
jgi:hypothetical protein